jgi:hypothetical protein
MRGSFSREIASQSEDSPLGGTVARQLWYAAQHGFRNRVNHATVARLYEVGPGRLRDKHGAKKVDVEHLSELIGCQRLEYAGLVDASVVDHGVDATERLDRGVDNRCRTMFVSNRGTAGDRFTIVIFDLADDVLGWSRGRTAAIDPDSVVGDHNTCTLGGEQ